MMCLTLYFKGPFDTTAFAKRLWGNVYFDDSSRKFTRVAADPEANRTFVQFILEPLYKLYTQVLLENRIQIFNRLISAQVLSSDTDTLKTTLASLGIHLKPLMYKMDVRPLLKAVLDQFFGRATGFVDMIVEHIPSPIEGASAKVIYRQLLSLHFGAHCCNL